MSGSQSWRTRLMSPWEGHAQNVPQRDSSWGRSGRNVAGWRPTSRQGEGRRAAHRRTRGQTPEQALAAGPPARLLPGTQGSGGAGQAPSHLSHLSGPPTVGGIKASAPRPRALRKLGISCGLFWLLVLLLQAGDTPITSPDAPQWRPAAAPRGSHFCLWPVLERGHHVGKSLGRTPATPCPSVPDVMCGLHVLPSSRHRFLVCKCQDEVPWGCPRCPTRGGPCEARRL